MAHDRYQASGPQVEWQPGSNEQVLRNSQGITDAARMDEAEMTLLLHLYEFVMGEQFPDRRLDVADLTEWHRLWLGNLYEWAGELRAVNMSKGSFLFAATDQIPRLLQEFERECLHRCTPCHGMNEEALAEAIALCHVELVLIHPFREGNGRLARLLADVMAVQAGRGPLDYTPWDANKTAYFTAIQQGLDRNYAPMGELVSRALPLRGA